VLDNLTEIACGYEASRETAQARGTLHCLLCYQNRLPDLGNFLTAVRDAISAASPTRSFMNSRMKLGH